VIWKISSGLNTMDNDNICDLLTIYPDTIGGGSTGTVRTGTTYPWNTVAVKFVSDSCVDTRREFNINRFIYQAWVSVMESSPVSNASVVKPIRYISSGSQPQCGYTCAAVMERLSSPLDKRDDEYQREPGMSNGSIHITFNNSVPKSLLTTTIADAIRIESQFGSRGYLFSPSAIQQILDNRRINPFGMTLEDITYRIGMLEATSIFGAGYVPHCEYILSMGAEGIAVSAIDFGSSELIPSTVDVDQLANYISRSQELNLYYHPSSTAAPESCRKSYIDGVSLAYDNFETPQNGPLYDKLISIYNEYT
jgi:hypothetical protein